VSMWVAWKDTTGTNRQSVMIPQSQLSADGYPLASCTVEQQGGSELVVWIQCSVAGAAQLAVSIEELV
jgi:hypothetical protein